MGDHNVAAMNDQRQSQQFMHALLNDLTALERMIESGQIETGVVRIGAEQEMFLVDAKLRPASVAPQVLEALKEPRLTTEIGRFNLEANLSPQLFTGNCLNAMEQELVELVALARQGAATQNADIVLTGILPTIRQSDLTIENLSPGPRYEELNHVLQRMRGNHFSLHLKGLDELQLTHDNVLLEACCTSFQVHLQVNPAEFAQLYNLAQVITAPLLAVAANSPLLMGHRLWHESRIPLFQNAVDERSDARQLRAHPPRVSFGESWVKNSVVEIFQEEIARFRVVLTKHIEEDSLAVLASGALPELTALRLHNGTVWRWNRPCYGVANGIAHLRIENRVIPSGPSIIDEMANAAFFLGLMTALPEEYGDITRMLSFDEAKENFFTAARHGLRAQLNWIGGQSRTTSNLILEHLLPLARAGLKSVKIPDVDTDRYLSALEERVKHDQNGAQWTLRSFSAMGQQGTREQRLTALTAAMLRNQRGEQPVNQWELAQLDDASKWKHSYQTVGQFMSTDLFTVRPDDLVNLAACVMDWRHVRHVPVEDDEGCLVGLVSHRELLKLVAQGSAHNDQLTVRDVMKPQPFTVTPSTPTLDAIAIMREEGIGCLPVVENGKLVGLITAHDFLRLSAELLEAELRA